MSRIVIVRHKPIDSMSKFCLINYTLSVSIRFIAITVRNKLAFSTHETEKTLNLCFRATTISFV
jgi:hypothetical protein